MAKLTDAERLLNKAISAARKRLPLRTEGAITKQLDHFCGSLGEAYHVGAEETQGIIVGRLRKLLADEARECGKAVGDGKL